MRGVVFMVSASAHLQRVFCEVARRFQHCNATLTMPVLLHIMTPHISWNTIDVAVSALQVLQGADVMVVVLDSAAKARCWSTEGCSPDLKKLFNSPPFLKVILPEAFNCVTLVLMLIDNCATEQLAFGHCCRQLAIKSFRCSPPDVRIQRLAERR